MARRRVRRYRRGRGRWSANIKNISETQSPIPIGINNVQVDLCTNPIQTSTGVSQQYTVKNIELSVFAEIPASGANGGVEDLEHYIMFVPQGMTVGNDYNLIHPEYIMAYYYQGNPISDSLELGYKLKLKSRLSRRLQTGDKIIYFNKYNNTLSSPSTATYGINGICRWWTKAN